MRNQSLSRHHVAIQNFHRARREAAVEALVARITGQSADLLSYGDVVEKLGMDGQSTLGVQQIPVAAIVGSVGRYEDFSRTFLPRAESDEQRWASVATAAKIVTDLPPIDVYRIGESYFVADGNHRVSIARRQGIDYIDAYVTEVRTRVPLPPGGRPDELIIAAEYAEFLAKTQLDRSRPDVDLRVSVPGQYGHLENHIEAHRFWIEKWDVIELTFEQAAARWYDDAYLPLVQAIREQGVLRYFPGRTETDFFIWLSRHRAELQKEIGAIISPDLAVARITPRVPGAPEGPQATSLSSRIRHRLGTLLAAEPAIAIPVSAWSDDRRLARYSEHLFANILWPVCLTNDGELTEADEAALNQAVLLAVEEDALLWAICYACHPMEREQEAEQVAGLQQTIKRRKQALEMPINFHVEHGDPVTRTLDLAFLFDLIVLSRSLQDGDSPAPSQAVRAILARMSAPGRTRRPLLIAGNQGSSTVIERLLLVFDGRTESEEALFIGAYLAEHWGVEIILLPVTGARKPAQEMTYAQDYLALHEIETKVLAPVAADTGALLSNATAQFCNLIILPMNTLNRLHHPADQPDNLTALLTDWPHPILIAG